MITLFGFPRSNYYNKVKIALLEKGVAFDEQLVKLPMTDPALLALSPLGKVPFIRTPHGPLCESQVIADYLEAAYPATPLLPADSFKAAKVRELCAFMDGHLELVARELYGSAFFGGPALSEGSRARVRKLLDKNIAAFKQLAQFSPFVAGDTFTLADCSAYSALPALSLATKAAFGEDLLAAHGLPIKAYMAQLNGRASVQQVTADRKAEQSAAAASAA